MAEDVRAIEVSEVPGLEAVAREVKDSGRSMRIVHGDEILAVLEPAGKPRRRMLPGKPVTADDPFWNLIGIARSSGPGDISSNKTEYLVKILRSKHI